MTAREQHNRRANRPLKMKGSRHPWQCRGALPTGCHFWCAEHRVSSSLLHFERCLGAPQGHHRAAAAAAQQQLRVRGGHGLPTAGDAVPGARAHAARAPVGRLVPCCRGPLAAAARAGACCSRQSTLLQVGMQRLAHCCTAWRQALLRLVVKQQFGRLAVPFRVVITGRSRAAVAGSGERDTAADAVRTGTSPGTGPAVCCTAGRSLTAFRCAPPLPPFFT